MGKTHESYQYIRVLRALGLITECSNEILECLEPVATQDLDVVTCFNICIDLSTAVELLSGEPVLLGNGTRDHQLVLKTICRSYMSGGLPHEVPRTGVVKYE
jgi:hypothetical protein